MTLETLIYTLLLVSAGAGLSMAIGGGNWRETTAAAIFTPIAAALFFALGFLITILN